MKQHRRNIFRKTFSRLKSIQITSLSIRAKVTLWYAFFMVFLILISLAVITNLSQKSMLTNQKQNLIETVNDATNEIDGVGEFEFYGNGVFLMLYNSDHIYQDGIIPENFSASMTLSDHNIQTVGIKDQTYFMYDQSFEMDRETYWMRGMTPQTTPDPTWGFIVFAVSGFLPVFVLVTCLSGFFITKRAFRPVRKIQETAQSIADGDELSLRIGLPEGNDEIARLGKTVDYMLDKLERSFEKEKQFTSDVSHELRTPLAVILTESEYALQHTDSIHEAKESLAVINRQADNMSALINQLLFFTRADQTSFGLHYELFAVGPVISELAEDYRIPAEEKGMAIPVPDNPKEDFILNADKILFVRSLSNLIKNAICYSKYKGVINIQVSEEKHYLAVSVTDNGIGISAENLPKIWDRFFQEEESRNKMNSGSMGLGLSMVKTILEKHGGYVSAESEIGKGSVFTLYFPIS